MQLIRQKGRRHLDKVNLFDSIYFEVVKSLSSADVCCQGRIWRIPKDGREQWVKTERDAELEKQPSQVRRLDIVNATEIYNLWLLWPQ